MHDHENCTCGEDEQYSQAQAILAKSFDTIRDQYGILVDATLFKAVTETDFREFFLKNLFDNNHQYFTKWYDGLKKAIRLHLSRERVFPLSDADLNKLEKLFSIYKDAFEWNSMGWHYSPMRVEEMKNNGLVDRNIIHFPEISFRLGLLGDVMEGIKERYGEELTETLRQKLFKELVKEAAHVGMTRVDNAAVDYARRRAHGYIRPLLNRITTDLTKDLHTEEVIISSYVVRGIRDKEGARILARKLGNEQRERGYTRDYERVMRTELGEAYSLGRWQYEVKDAKQFGTHYPKELISQLNIKPSDLLVYKRTALTACKYCRTIWTHEDGTPKLYTEEYVKSREPNYGKPAEDWQPQLGLIHPNCRENGVRVARYGVDNLIYRKMFDYPVQDGVELDFD